MNPSMYRIIASTLRIYFESHLSLAYGRFERVRLSACMSVSSTSMSFQFTRPRFPELLTFLVVEGVNLKGLVNEFAVQTNHYL